MKDKKKLCRSAGKACGRGKKEKVMRKWKKWLAVALAAASMTGSPLSFTDKVQAAPYTRWGTVAEEERVPAAYAKENERAKERKEADPKAWRRINGICYNGSGEEIPGAVTRGIDVSEWQDRINWMQVKGSDVDFAFVRLSYGVKKLDKFYDYNMEQAELAGLPVGTYVYSLATTTEQALAEAQYAIEAMDGRLVSYPVVFDLEYSEMQKLTRRQVSILARTFCEEVRRAGYHPMVYTNTNWYDTEVDWSLLEGYDVWLARYGDRIQAPSHADYKYGIWQCTDGDGGGTLNPTKGLIHGIDKGNNVDMNFGFIDYTKVVTPRKNTAPDYVPSRHPETDLDGDPWGSKAGWQTKDGKTYYSDANGKKVSGWNKIEGNYYYFDTKTNALHKEELITTGNNLYYVDEDGVRVIGDWVTHKGKTYYMSAKGGVALKGQKKIGDKYYRFNKTSGIMYKNRRVLDSRGDIYYYGSDGARYENGFYKIAIKGTEKTFYFRDGKAHKGWLTLDGKKYYFYKGTALTSGTRAENITLTDSRKIVSVFDKKGVCIKQYQKKR